jgi:peptide/nickel transport system substrate-binding protein
VIDAPDSHTVVFRYEKPFGALPDGLAAQGFQRPLFLPAHYMKQFHDAFVPLEELKKKAKDAGFVQWRELFLNRCDLDRNPECPTLAPFKIQVPPPSGRCIAVRNPYYWKVDPEGKQLPYIDEIVFTMAFDPTVLNLKAMSGEVDFQIRRIDAGNFTLFRERGRELGYRALVYPSTNSTCIYINQCSKNDKMRPILRDRRLRLAMAHAINREEIIELIYTGLAVPASGVAVPDDPYYVDGYDTVNTEYDPARAEQLLDEMGLKRGRDGMRLLPDGTPFRQILHVCPSEEGTNADLWQLVADNLRAVGLPFAIKHHHQSLAFVEGTSGDLDFWCYATAGLWFVDGIFKVPVANSSYVAPLAGLYYYTEGKQGMAPPPDLQRLVDMYLQMRQTTDMDERLRLGRAILTQWKDECYVVGICRSPMVAIVGNNFHNVPDRIPYDYQLKSPGFLGIEQFFMDEAGER